MDSWDIDTYDRIIRQIYEASGNNSSWNETINVIGDHFGFADMHLMLFSNDRGIEYLTCASRNYPNFGSGHLRDYALEAAKRLRNVSDPSTVAFDESIIDSQEKMEASGTRHGLSTRHKTYGIMSSTMSIGDCLGWFAVTTRNPSVGFSDEQRNAFCLLVPHIMQSLKMTKTNMDLQMACNLSSSAIDHVGAAVFLFLNGQLETMNTAGRDITNEGFFTIRDRNLACQQTLMDRRLQTYLENTNAAAEPPLLLRDMKHHVEYCVRCHDPAPKSAKIIPGENAGRIVSVIKLRGFKKPSTDEVEVFAQSYGLSEAEVHVLHAVLSHEGLKELSDVRGVNLDTVRKQLKSAMGKMDVSSQKSLFQMFERFRTLGASS